jgi:hypothetical protein
MLQWLESDIDLIEMLDDTEITESEQYGDKSMILLAEVKGERRDVSNVPMTISKRFDILPGYGDEQELNDEIAQSRNLGVNSIEEFDEKSNEYNEIDIADPKLAIEFSDPIIVGSTKYIVEYGNGNIGEGFQTDTYVPPSDHGVPLFYKIYITPYENADYHIMFSQELYKGWRIATEEDRSDMDGNTISTLTGNPYTIPGDESIKDTTHFYVKRMNKKYSDNGLEWFTYLSEEKIYYMNEDGILVEDPNFSVESEYNPIDSLYIDRSVYVKLTPIDLIGSPLFIGHSEAIYPGYKTGLDPAITKNMATKVSKVKVSSDGVYVIYEQYAFEKKFMDILFIGYSLNKITNIKVTRRSDGYDHEDAKSIKIESSLIQNYHVAQRKAAQIIDFWGFMRSIYSRSNNYDPRLRPSTLVVVTSSKFGYDKQLFFIESVTNKISSNTIFTNIQSMIQV